MKYKIVTAMSRKVLAEKVNDYLEDDWIPQGGMCADGSTLAQAIIKVPESKKSTYGLKYSR